ncbi:KGGVGR-motif variant AAA ATPase [Pseudomonas fragariae (ex Marin et al. 2024)]|uniref:ParA family protein n=1 Tax=Pseudomonas TaxID=286 RepID=UPI001F0F4928|nr:ParA family protein [Pseudomonas syringae]MCH5510597.1 ParA family protein [Pseudomonas syringae pv. syringae]MCH5639298.1 ParA family protein [Pseudomonas syringae pv. syringae]MCH7428487.1 ParA family protein [Pseudomonas syringae pv. syringae]
MSLIQPKRPPMTWLDVEREFKISTENFSTYPAGVNLVRCFYDGVEIETSVQTLATAWLKEVFDRYYDPDLGAITMAIGDSQYPVSFAQSNDEPSKPTQYPLWREQAYLKPKIEKPLPEKFSSGPKMVSFHSFKGGVGRTTALMTYASALLNARSTNNTKILLVDADLEAPGISLWLDATSMPTVSFVKFLEAMHYPPESTDQALEYFASELRKTSINLDGVRKELFILPSAINLSEIMDMPVLPSHIAKNPRNPWLLIDHLHALGELLDVDMVFIDLRAGLSELSSPVLFDTRVEHFFVTTIAHQSVLGMAAILEHVGRSQFGAKKDEESLLKPSVILSLLTPSLRKLPDYTLAIERLNGAYIGVNGIFNDDSEEFSPSIDWVEAEFESSLMSVNSISQALDLLPKAPLYENAKKWADSRAQNKILQPENDEVERPNLKSDIASLYNVCEGFQFAEKSTSTEMLVTDPLRNLAKHYSSELPNIVSVGAKGAGKTFTFLQLCRTKTWKQFLTKINIIPPQIAGGHIFPAISSQNIDGDSLAVVRDAVEEFTAALDIPSISLNNIQIRITKLLAKTDVDWTEAWEQCLVESIGQPFNTFIDLNLWLLKNGKSIVYVIDGIEDLFDSPSSDNQRAAIKALLEIPNSLNALRQRNIGLICFVRADYVQASIRQNIAQYLARFQPFRLEWTPDTFLRLVYWLCSKSKIVRAESSLAETLSREELLGALEDLWGKKMGGNASKEANSARWVFAALCDLNGRLQARDVVRFLKFSAKQMQTKRIEAWPDRLLYPEAIRQSLSECSREKVEEAIAEILPLREWQLKLQDVAEDSKKVPFNPGNVGLTEELIRSLKDIGVIYEDIDRIEEPDRFYLPEIYRTGLGFKSAVGGRPRVQALLKRNLGGMPF